MAKFDQVRFAEAADALVAAGFGDGSLAATDTDGIRKAATAVAEALEAAGSTAEGSAAIRGLRSVATLRPSIARRFVTLSLRPRWAAAAEAAKPTPKARKPKE